MKNLELHLFSDSFGPFVTLLNERSINYQMRQVRSELPMASSEIVELLRAASLLPSLAVVICAFLKNKRSRKVIITTEDNTIVHIEGLNEAEVLKILKQAKSITAIETNRAGL